MAMKRKGTMQKSGVLPEKVRNQFELLQHELNITFINKIYCIKHSRIHLM